MTPITCEHIVMARTSGPNLFSAEWGELVVKRRRFRFSGEIAAALSASYTRWKAGTVLLPYRHMRLGLAPFGAGPAVHRQAVP